MSPSSEVVALFLLVLLGRLKTTWSAAIALMLAVGLATLAFQEPVGTAATGAAKGLWLGTWILCVIVPALLQYRLAKRAGMENLGETFARYLPNPTDRLLLLAWIFPSFIQGVWLDSVRRSRCALRFCSWATTRSALSSIRWSATTGR